MTHHAIDFGVHQFLRSSCALLGISGIVFRQQFKLNLFATDGNTFGIEFFDSQTCAVFIVFTQVGNGATEGSNVTNLDNFLSHAHGSHDTHGQGHC